MWHLFLDESGDLGFEFEQKLASRYLTISILAVQQANDANSIRNAVKKTLRRKVNLGRLRKCPATELKGTRTTLQVKEYFYNQIANVEFGIYAVTLDKQRVPAELNPAGSTDHLYNFIARQVIDQIPLDSHEPEHVHLIVDRSKGKRGIAEFDEHVKTQLEGRLAPKTTIVIQHSTSDSDHGLSAVDLFCWGIFRSKEHQDFEWYDYYRSRIKLDTLYP